MLKTKKVCLKLRNYSNSYESMRKIVKKRKIECERGLRDSLGVL